MADDKKGGDPKKQEAADKAAEQAAKRRLTLEQEIAEARAEAAGIFETTSDQEMAASRVLSLEAKKARIEAQKIADAAKAAAEAGAENADELERAAIAAAAGAEEAERAAEAATEQAQASAQIEANSRNMLRSMTGISDDWQNTGWGAVLTNPAGITAGLNTMGKEMKRMADIGNIGGSMLMKVQEATFGMVMAASTHFAEINKLTGATGEYNSMIIETMQHNSQFNVDMGTATKAVGDLYTEMSLFTTMSKETQAELVEVTAQLEAVGLSSDVTAGNFEIMTKAMGMSTDEAINAQMEFVGLAKELGVSATKIGKDFQANQSVFAKWGDNAIQVFKEVSAASKATGIEMSSLLNITGQFDTFEGAANAAGKLNAILGGGVLNSMDLLNASEEERIRMLIQSISLSGKSWDSMNRFEKMAVANAAGISDMAEASKIFGQSLGEYDAMVAKADAAAASQAELEERAAAAASVQDKLTRIMEAFAIAVEPIVNAIMGLLNGILWLNDATGGMLIPTLAVLIGIYGVWWKWNQIQSAQQKKDALEKLLLAQQTGALTLAEGLNTAGKSASIAPTKGAALAQKGMAHAGKQLMAVLVPMTPAIISLGFALGGLGLAIAAPFLALAALAIAMKDIVRTLFEFSDRIMEVALGLAVLGPIAMVTLPMIGIGIIGLAFALMIAAPMLFIAAPAILQFSMALFVLGGAIKMIGSGLQSLADGFSEFPHKMVVKTALALLLAAPMLMLAGALLLPAGITLGPAAFLVGIGLKQLGGGIAAFNKEGALKTMVLLGPALLIFSAFMMPVGGMLLAAAPSVLMGGLGVGVGLMAMGAGIKAFMEEGIHMHMLKLGPSLLLFSLWMIPAGLGLVAAAPLLLIGGALVGLGLKILAVGIVPFTDKGMIKTMALLGPTLALFGLSLAAAGPFLAAAAPQILIAGGLIGIGLYVLGQGLQEMKRTGGTMVMMMMVLPPFAVMLLFASQLLLQSSLKMLVAGTLLGLGLAALGWGINVWDGGTILNALLLGPVLTVMSILLLVATAAMATVAPAFFASAVLIGLGLGVLGLAMQLFDGQALLAAFLIGPALVVLSAGLLLAVIPMAAVAGMFVPAALLVGFALGVLGLALNLFGKKALRAAFLVGPALAILGISLMLAVVPMWLAAILFVPAAMQVGLGLLILGTAIRLIRRSIRYMARIGPALQMFAEGLMAASWRMWIAAIFFAPAVWAIALPLIALSIGIRGLGKALKKWGPDGGERLKSFAEGMFYFALALLPASLIMIFAAPYFFQAALMMLPAALLMGVAMAILADPFIKVAAALSLILPHAGGMPALALGLMMLGPALISFGFGLFMLGIFASLPFFKTGLDTFITALWAMATAFQAIPTEKAVALGQVFQGLAQLTDLDNAGSILFDVAMGIFWIARALETLPEEKTISMALLATNMSDLISAAVELKPENVEAVEGVVKAAADYANVASAMPTPDMDPFVQALKSALGLGGEGEDGGGQDIVLELDGRELGRAIDAHINSRHGLNID
tara:strand:+ start:2932 stop:7488 length:4557 start_codon:yes stop_codon:yes gene_type:complete